MNWSSGMPIFRGALSSRVRRADGVGSLLEGIVPLIELDSYAPSLFLDGCGDQPIGGVQAIKPFLGDHPIRGQSLPPSYHLASFPDRIFSRWRMEYSLHHPWCNARNHVPSQPS